MTDAFKPRWFFPTPGRLLAVLLAVEALLWLSERFRWFAFQHKSWTVLIAVGSVGAFLVLMLGWFRPRPGYSLAIPVQHLSPCWR